jgi:hypothetical protein
MEAVEGSEWRKEHSGARCFNQKVRYLDVAYISWFHVPLIPRPCRRMP